MAISKTALRTNNKRPDTSHSVFETAPKATLIMLFTGLFILLISTIIALKLPSPATYSKVSALASLLLGSAAGGYFCALRLDVRSAYISASIAILTLILLMVITRVFIPFTVPQSSSVFTVIGYVAAIAFCVGGVLSGKQMTSNKKKRRKKHYWSYK